MPRFSTLGLITAVVFMPAVCEVAHSAEHDFITIPQEFQPKGEAYVRGKQILHDSIKAYAGIAKYVGTIKLSSTATYKIGQPPGTKRSFEIQYEAPGKLQMVTRDSNNDPLIFVIDPDSVIVVNSGEKERFKSAEEALAASSGVTLYGSYVLPGCLLDIDWHNEESLLPENRSFLSAWATKARLDGTVQVEGHDCHRIVCERDVVSWTIYVDKKTMLLRRADCETNEAHMRKLRTIGEGGGATGRLLAFSRSQTFSIDELKWKEQPEDNGEDKP
jgi:hypothetical protein